MTENMKYLIDACMSGDRKKIEDAVEYCVKADRSAKDKQYCERVLKAVTHQRGTRIEIPPNCAGFLTAEHPDLIDSSRYLMTCRDQVQIEKMAKMNAVSGILMEKGIRCVSSILLHGEPGVGKTMFGRMVAKKLNLPFLYMNFSYVLDSYLGGTQKNFSKVFRFVEQLPCVLMLDELDAIAVKRGVSTDVGEINRVTICIMQELDRVGSHVVVIGATNRIDIIDEAIVSRLGDVYCMKRFTEEERMQFVKMYVNSAGMHLTDQELESLYMEDCTQRMLEKKVIRFISEQVYRNL